MPIIIRSNQVSCLQTFLRRSHSQVRQASSTNKVKYSYSFTPGDTILSHATLGQLVDKAADEAGDTTAFVTVHQGIRKTFSQFKNEVDLLASGLISFGLRKGDRVGLCSPNVYEWILTQFATAKAGLILVNVNPAYQIQELKYCLKKVGCKALITSETYKTQNFYEMLCSFVPELPKCKPGQIESPCVPDLRAVILISEKEKQGTVTFDNVMTAGDSQSRRLLADIENVVQFDDPVNIQFTSGTTGSPKGATLTHHNIVNNALMTGKRLGYHLEKPSVCCQVPLYHCFGCVLGTLGTVIFQNTCTFPAPGFDAEASIKCIEKERCTTIYGTPTMYVDVLRKQESGVYDLSCLKQAVIGGAPCPENVLRQIKAKLHVKHLHNAYGSTENSPAVAVGGLNDDFEKQISNLVKPLEYVEMKIINDKGQLLPVNTDGELCTRGHIMFLGYWDEEKKTKEVVDKTNWYHSGDLAYMDEDGFIKIVGRKSDMVIRGGENIYPQEIENFLHTHPHILEAHVVGVQDERMGEELCACVIIKDGHSLTELDIKNFCKGKISHFKIPLYILFVDDFPKTISGKIQKFKLREIALKKLKL